MFKHYCPERICCVSWWFMGFCMLWSIMFPCWERSGAALHSLRLVKETHQSFKWTVCHFCHQGSLYQNRTEELVCRRVRTGGTEPSHIRLQAQRIRVLLSRLKSGFMFTPVYRPDCSSDPRRWPPPVRCFCSVTFTNVTDRREFKLVGGVTS